MEEIHKGHNENRGSLRLYGTPINPPPKKQVKGKNLDQA